jgi:F-type H+-transporting ATPase subunit a
VLEFDYMILGVASPLEHVVVRPLFSFDLWGFEIVVSNHMFMVTLALVLLILILPLAVKGKGLVRKGFGNLIETVCVFIREEMARPFLGDRTDKHIGFIWTMFFFVLTLNLLGMIPLGKIIYLVTGKGSHLEGAATANIWVTGALAMVAFITIHVAGMREQGVWGYFRDFAPKVPWPMLPLIYFMEIVGALVKPFALAIRLFANMFAGHMLLAAVLGFIFVFKNYSVASLSVLGVVVMSFLEIFVAFLQAYIFTFLTTIFIGFAVRPEH